MRMWSPHPRSAGWRSGFASLNDCSAAKAGKRRKRGPQTRAGDGELTAEIRRLVDTRPSYGYRRIAALLKRERRAAGLDPVNAKRVYRLMKKHGLLLARHTGRRLPRAHDGTIMTSRSNERWCSEVLEFTWRNSDVLAGDSSCRCHPADDLAIMAGGAVLNNWS
jgi:transposase InsO family protein